MYTCFFFFKQKTAYEMRISDWSSDVCSSDLFVQAGPGAAALAHDGDQHVDRDGDPDLRLHRIGRSAEERLDAQVLLDPFEEQLDLPALAIQGADRRGGQGALIGEQHDGLAGRSEEHTSELQSLMRISYAVFCLKKKKN